MSNTATTAGDIRAEAGDRVLGERELARVPGQHHDRQQDDGHPSDTVMASIHFVSLVTMMNTTAPQAKSVQAH